jgi:hypothetical protein
MKCKDIANEYNVTAMQVGRLRKKFFPDHMGGELSDEEVETLIAYFEDSTEIDERDSMEEAVKPRFIEGFVSYAQKGRRLVECKVRGAGGIETVHALIPNGQDPVTILRKSIKLEYIEKSDGTKRYRHASLANYAWPETF